jgi:hypothetical protein
MAVFRGKMLDAIRRALTRGELVMPEGLRPQQVLNLEYVRDACKK